jgi:hypothetical protein
MNKLRLCAQLGAVGIVLAGAACSRARSSAEPTPLGGATPGITIAVPAPSSVSIPAELSIATPAPITPVATDAAGARADCPDAWLTYSSAGGRLTMCGPDNIDATSDVDAGGQPGIILGTRSHNGVPEPGLLRFVVAPRTTAHPVFAIDDQLPEFCRDGWRDGIVVRRAFGGVTFDGCQWTLEPGATEGPLISTVLVARLPGSRYLNVTINWRSADGDARDLAETIASTIRVRP